ncbi:hypothetical protein ACIRF8_02785 [Streptomyces sp. NPDC102406]|uniref:hypothetical protein n=1 Tax=Streptomyces sp. NPDC102406 TaxID=3366171 RepID=UPI00380FD159
MKLTRPKILAVAGVTIVIIVAALAYVFKWPPFKEEGEIKAADVCASLGHPKHATDTLRKLLPERSSYNFDDTGSGGVDESGLSYRSSCMVTGGSEAILLRTQTESMPYESAEDWLKWVRTKALNESSTRAFTRFPAGDEAAASKNFAAIFIPCVAKKDEQRPQYNISLTVELGRPGDSATRAGLIDLARSAASYAHEKAGCAIPLKSSGT